MACGMDEWHDNGGREEEMRHAHAALSWNLTTRLPPLSCGICRVIVKPFYAPVVFGASGHRRPLWDRGGDPVFVGKGEVGKRAQAFDYSKLEDMEIRPASSRPGNNQQIRPAFSSRIAIRWGGK